MLAHAIDQKTMLLIVFMLFSFFFSISQTALAAQVVVSPTSGSYSDGEFFTVNVQVDPEGNRVNAVESKLTFDPTKLSVVSISKIGSIFTLWTTEPTFSNTDGIVRFGGGTPDPFLTKSTLVSITFKALDVGHTNVSVSSASVLAADGVATQVYTGPLNATYTIKPSAGSNSTTSISSHVALNANSLPLVPEANSTIFSDPETWYGTKNGTFTWQVPPDVDKLALNVSTSSDYDPTTISKPPIDTVALNDAVLHDGIQYLTLQYHNKTGWGATLHRKVMIDTTPPERFTIVVDNATTPSAFPHLAWEATDTVSGIKTYALTINGQDPIDISPDKARNGYSLSNLEDGTYMVTVTAYDLADNKTVATLPVSVTQGWHPPASPTHATTSFESPITGKNFTILLLLVLNVLQFIYLFMNTKTTERHEQQLRAEMQKMHDHTENIFSALRHEMYEQTNGVAQQGRSSKQPRKVPKGSDQVS